MSGENGNGYQNGRHPDICSKYTRKTVLGIGAHPDDLELGVGGTLACLSEAGARVVMAIVSIPNQFEVRRAEALCAADILRCDLRFLVPDRPSRVEEFKNYELVGMIDNLILDYSPAAVFTHSLANYHIDHKLVHEACLSSQRLGYFDLFCYGPTTSRPMNIPFTPSAFVDISHKIETKMESINAHASQFRHRGLTTDHCREMDRRHGQMIDVDYAEGFEIVRLKLNLVERPADADIVRQTVRTGGMAKPPNRLVIGAGNTHTHTVANGARHSRRVPATPESEAGRQEAQALERAEA